MFTSRWVFSMIFDASALLIFLALIILALTTDWYKSDTILSEYLFEDDTTLLILTNECFLSPGLIRSGENPQ